MKSNRISEGSRARRVKAGVVGVRQKGQKRVNAMEESRRSTLPELPENMKGEVAEAIKRHEKRTASPGAAVYSRKGGSYYIDSPHRDIAAWEVQICEAFGTRSHSVMWTFLDDVARLCRSRSRLDPETGAFAEWVPDQLELSAILGIIHAEQPATPLQAAMLAQMVANHLMQMRIGANLLSRSGDYLPPERVATFARLTNAFANQVEAYQKLRGRAPKARKMTVIHKKEVHLHHHQHRHAHLSPQGEVSRVSCDQPQETIHGSYVEKLPGAESLPTGEPPGGPPLPGEDAPGVVVPMRRAEGSDPLQTPRRSLAGRPKG